MAEHLAGRPQFVCQIFYDLDVVCLKAGGGHAVYLGLNGRGHYENYGEEQDVVVLTDPRALASVIVKWSGAVGLSELIELLPPRPPNGFVCRLCEGSRWEEVELPTSGKDKLCCRRCCGLGWTLAELLDSEAL
jgi:hypothetical protein